jgi:hypothetical protein
MKWKKSDIDLDLEKYYYSNPLFLELNPNLRYSTSNPHPKVVKKLLQKKEYNPWNIHPKIVEKYIKHRFIDYEFSQNPSDLAVDYLISNPHLINWSCFLQNTNPRAIDYIIQKWNEIPNHHKRFFSCNESQKAVDFLVQNSQFIYSNWLQQYPFNYSYNRLKYVKSKRLLVKKI